jgi:hypothetical protein
MTWWLAALLKHEVEPATHNPSHPMPQVDALLQAVSTESTHDRDTQHRPATFTHSGHLALARGLRRSIR